MKCSSRLAKCTCKTSAHFGENMWRAAFEIGQNNSTESKPFFSSKETEHMVKILKPVYVALGQNSINGTTMFKPVGILKCLHEELIWRMHSKVIERKKFGNVCKQALMLAHWSFLFSFLIPNNRNFKFRRKRFSLEIRKSGL